MHLLVIEMFISKRKIRFVLFVILGVIVVSCSVRAVVQSQLNKEIKYFKTYFEQKKDGINGLYNPLVIKQIPEETIDALYSSKSAQLERNSNAVNWSQLAYVNYATNADYLCNTLIMFSALKRYGTEAKLMLLVSKDLLDPEVSNDVDKTRTLLSRISRLDQEQVIVKFVDDIMKPMDTSQWSESLTKLLVFNQTEFDRIIYLDNDARLNDKLDELFFIPDYIKFAAPLTYWFLSDHDLQEAYDEVKNYERLPTNLARYTEKLNDRVRKNKMIYNHLPSLPPNLFLDSKNVAQDIIRSKFSLASLLDFHIGSKPSKVKFASNVMVIKPSSETFQSIMETLLPNFLNMKNKYDMDLINDQLYNLKRIIYDQFNQFRRLRTLFVPEVLVLPFARYGLLTGSIKNEQHDSIIRNDILGYKRLDTDGKEIPKELSDLIKESKYIHFSDYPMGKPWEYNSMKDITCTASTKKGKINESERKACIVWNSIYESFLSSRSVCLT